MFFRLLGGVNVWPLAASLARADRRAQFKPRPGVQDQVGEASVREMLISRPGWTHPDVAKWPPMKTLLARANTLLRQVPDYCLDTVRIEQLEPDSVIAWSREEGLIDVHVAIVTNAAAVLIAGNEVMHIPANAVVLHGCEVWHSAVNMGQWPRLHLVLTLVKQEITDE